MRKFLTALLRRSARSASERAFSPPDPSSSFEAEMRRKSRRDKASRGALARLWRANPPADPEPTAWAAVLARIQAMVSRGPRWTFAAPLANGGVLTEPRATMKECHP